MNGHVTCWVGIGAMVAAGLWLSRQKATQVRIAADSKTGPPFYFSAGNQALIQTGFSSIRRAISENPAGQYGYSGNGAAAVLRANMIIREESQKARLKEWRNATQRSKTIIQIPNSRKPVIVNTW